MDGPSTNSELAQLKHELEVLRSRYAIFERWAKIWKAFFAVLAVAVVGLVVYALMTDTVLGIAGLAFVCVTAVIGFLLRGQFRWIDLASQTNIAGRNYMSSEAMAIEDLIAGREKRLAELKRGTP